MISSETESLLECVHFQCSVHADVYIYRQGGKRIGGFRYEDHKHILFTSSSVVYLKCL